MLNNSGRFEKRDGTIYDNVHEFCRCEKVNEEQFSISEKIARREHSRARTKKLIVIAMLRAIAYRHIRADPDRIVFEV